MKEQLLDIIAIIEKENIPFDRVKKCFILYEELLHYLRSKYSKEQLQSESDQTTQLRFISCLNKFLKEMLEYTTAIDEVAQDIHEKLYHNIENTIPQLKTYQQSLKAITVSENELNEKKTRINQLDRELQAKQHLAEEITTRKQHISQQENAIKHLEEQCKDTKVEDLDKDIKEKEQKINELQHLLEKKNEITSQLNNLKESIEHAQKDITILENTSEETLPTLSIALERLSHTLHKFDENDLIPEQIKKCNERIKSDYIAFKKQYDKLDKLFIDNNNVHNNLKNSYLSDTIHHEADKITAEIKSKLEKYTAILKKMAEAIEKKVAEESQNY